MTHSVLELVYLMLPAYCANMAAPFTKFWRDWNRPINERLLGSHKTVVGFALGVAIAIGVASGQRVVMSEKSSSFQGFCLGGPALIAA